MSLLCSTDHDGPDTHGCWGQNRRQRLTQPAPAIRHRCASPASGQSIGRCESLIEVRDDTGTSIASGSWESGDDLVLSDLSLGSSTYFIEVAPASPDELEAAGNYYRLDIAHSRP